MTKKTKRKEKERSSSRKIEKRISTPYKKAYVPLLEDDAFEWRWEERKVLEFDDLWKAGFSIWRISKHFKRDPDEVLVLALDRIRGGKIKDRAGGLSGTIT